MDRLDRREVVDVLPRIFDLGTFFDKELHPTGKDIGGTDRYGLNQAVPDIFGNHRPWDDFFEEGKEGGGVEEAGKVFPFSLPQKVEKNSFSAAEEKFPQRHRVAPVDVFGPKIFPKGPTVTPLFIQIMTGRHHIGGVDGADRRAALDVELTVFDLGGEHGPDVMNDARFIGAAGAAAGKNKSQFSHGIEYTGRKRFMLGSLPMERNKDYALTIVRIVLGIIFFMHGSQKVLGWFGGDGLVGTVHAFTEMGMPAVIAYSVCFTEFFGGISLFFGLLTRLAAFGIFCVMVGAIALVHWHNGFFLNWFMKPGVGHGYEYNLALIAMLLGLIFGGGGWGSLDGLWYRPKKKMSIQDS